PQSSATLTGPAFDVPRVAVSGTWPRSTRSLERRLFDKHTVARIDVDEDILALVEQVQRELANAQRATGPRHEILYRVAKEDAPLDAARPDVQVGGRLLAQELRVHRSDRDGRRATRRAGGRL